MTTVILCVSADTGLNGSFLMDRTTETIEEARAWFTDWAEGMAKSGHLDSTETLYGLTFADKSLNELEREFPYLFDSGDWVCGCNDGGL